MPKPHLYVFSSQIDAEQLIPQQDNSQQFKLYKLTGGKLEKVPEINIGTLKIKIDDLNDLYRSHFAVFSSEVKYWLHCDTLKRIVRRG